MQGTRWAERLRGDLSGWAFMQTLRLMWTSEHFCLCCAVQVADFTKHAATDLTKKVPWIGGERQM